ncbi:unnamed protein product [Colias eurytheme]|nr:unnamed protein product [Colias eurytheme]
MEIGRCVAQKKFLSTHSRRFEGAKINLVPMRGAGVSRGVTAKVGRTSPPPPRAAPRRAPAPRRNGCVDNTPARVPNPRSLGG